MIYFDNAATTPLSEKALEAMLPYFSELCANPHGLYKGASQARKAVETAREQVAALIGAEAEEIFFTSGGTESDNIAVLGGVRASGKRRAITVKTEHPAVLRCFEELEKEGFDIVYARRIARKDDFIKKSTSSIFHRVFSHLSGMKSDKTVANFGIYS
ncbi:MAG: aminotransferase class V-fold PLP-dependent enzyme, partial [Lachnospiraceae bacterium]|nr:aminotransferase class V-fold PLP-dependent enzyme [Lachnospiraceae bacterium]